MTAYHDENDCYSCRICGQWFDNPDDAKECCYLEKLEEISPEEEDKMNISSMMGKVVSMDGTAIVVGDIHNPCCDLCKNTVEFNVKLRADDGGTVFVCSTCLEELVRKEIEARAVTKVKRIKCLYCENLHDNIVHALNCCNKSMSRDEFTCTYCHASYRYRQQADMCCQWYKVAEVMV